MIEILMLIGILVVVILPMLAKPNFERSESPGERRARGKAYRKDRRERAVANAGPIVDKDGNMITNGRRNYRISLFWIRRFIGKIGSNVKQYSRGAKWVHEWYRAHLTVYRHPKGTYAVLIGCALVSYVCLVMMFGDVMYGSAFGLILPLAAIQPYEMPNTGVDAEDWGKISENYTDVEIQAAIDYARVNDKGLVYLSDTHDWVISNQIDITYTAIGTHYPGVHIMGAGINNTILDASGVGLGVGEYVFSNDHNAAPDTRILLLYYSGFRIEGNATAAGGLYAQYISSAEGGGFFIDDIEIRDFSGGRGAFIKYAFRSEISHLNLYNNNFGLYLEHVNAATVASTRSLLSTVGICSTYGTSNIITGATLESNTSQGILIKTGYNNVVCESYFEANAIFSIDVTRHNFAYNGGGTQIHDNYIFGLGASYAGINSRGTSDRINNNVIRDHRFASIVFDYNSVATWEMHDNMTYGNYSEDDTFVLIGSAGGTYNVIHTIISETEYTDKIEDYGSYTIWPDMEYSKVVNNNPKAYGYVGSEDSQLVINAVGEVGGQAITITEPIVVESIILTLRNDDANTNFTIYGKVYGCTGTPGTNGTMDGNPALATSTNSFTGLDLAAAGGAGTQKTFTFDPHILPAGNYVFAVEVTAHVNGGCQLRDDNTGSAGSGNLAYDVGGGPTFAVTADCYNWELQVAGGSTTMFYGDVVVYDEAANNHAKHTTTGDDGKVAGVVYDANTAQGAACVILTKGQIGKLKVNGTADIVVGDLLSAHTDEGILQKGTIGSGACIAIARGNYSTNDSLGEIPGTIISPR